MSVFYENQFKIGRSLNNYEMKTTKLILNINTF